MTTLRHAPPRSVTGQHALLHSRDDDRVRLLPRQAPWILARIPGFDSNPGVVSTDRRDSPVERWRVPREVSTGLDWGQDARIDEYCEDTCSMSAATSNVVLPAAVDIEGALTDVKASVRVLGLTLASPHTHVQLLRAFFTTDRHIAGLSVAVALWETGRSAGGEREGSTGREYDRYVAIKAARTLVREWAPPLGVGPGRDSARGGDVSKSTRVVRLSRIVRSEVARILGAAVDAAFDGARKRRAKRDVTTPKSTSLAATPATLISESLPGALNASSADFTARVAVDGKGTGASSDPIDRVPGLLQLLCEAQGPQAFIDGYVRRTRERSSSAAAVAAAKSAGNSRSARAVADLRRALLIEVRASGAALWGAACALTGGDTELAAGAMRGALRHAFLEPFSALVVASLARCSGAAQVEALAKSCNPLAPELLRELPEPTRAAVGMDLSGPVSSMAESTADRARAALQTAVDAAFGGRTAVPSKTQRVLSGLRALTAFLQVLPSNPRGSQGIMRPWLALSIADGVCRHARVLAKDVVIGFPTSRSLSFSLDAAAGLSSIRAAYPSHTPELDASRVVGVLNAASVAIVDRIVCAFGEIVANSVLPCLFLDTNWAKQRDHSFKAPFASPAIPYLHVLLDSIRNAIISQERRDARGGNGSSRDAGDSGTGRDKQDAAIPVHLADSVMRPVLGDATAALAAAAGGVRPSRAWDAKYVLDVAAAARAVHRWAEKDDGRWWSPRAEAEANKLVLLLCVHCAPMDDITAACLAVVDGKETGDGAAKRLVSAAARVDTSPVAVSAAIRKAAQGLYPSAPADTTHGIEPLVALAQAERAVPDSDTKRQAPVIDYKALLPLIVRTCAFGKRPPTRQTVDESDVKATPERTRQGVRSMLPKLHIEAPMSPEDERGAKSGHDSAGVSAVEGLLSRKRAQLKSDSRPTDTRNVTPDDSRPLERTPHACPSSAILCVRELVSFVETRNELKEDHPRLEGDALAAAKRLRSAYRRLVIYSGR